MDKEAPKSWVRAALNIVYITIAMMVVLGVFVSPGKGDFKKALSSATMQTARTIALCLNAYSLDHNNHYPEGQTSTEIFQKLIDGKYVEDLSIFYLPLPGKVRPLSSQLKPENVAWDVTCCVDSSSPDTLPLVYLTGFKIDFQPGGAAKRINPLPRTWTIWWNGPDRWQTFMAMAAKGNSARVFELNEDGSIPNFVPADFDPKGKTYRQLTP